MPNGIWTEQDWSEIGEILIKLDKRNLVSLMIAFMENLGATPEIAKNKALALVEEQNARPEVSL